MPGAHSPEHCGDFVTLLGRSGGEPFAQGAVTGIDAHAPAGFRVHQVDLADVGQILFTRVLYLDAEHSVTPGKTQEHGFPVSRPAEVGHDHNDPVFASNAGGVGKRIP